MRIPSDPMNHLLTHGTTVRYASGDSRGLSYSEFLEAVGRLAMVWSRCSEWKDGDFLPFKVWSEPSTLFL